MDLDVQVNKLKALKTNYTSQLYYLQDKITIHYPEMIKNSEQNNRTTGTSYCNRSAISQTGK